MGSIFASQTKETIALPFDSPQTVTIRKLTGREVEAAQREDAAKMAAGRGWAERLQKLLREGVSDDVLKQKLMDPLIGYDRHMVLLAGIAGWSYTDKPDEKPLKVTPERVADLDDEAADFIAREILRLTKPALFATAEELKAQQKNG